MRQKITDEQAAGIWAALKGKAEPGTLDSLETWLEDYGLEKGQKRTDKALGISLVPSGSATARSLLIISARISLDCKTSSAPHSPFSSPA